MRKQEYTWKPILDSTRPVRWGHSLKIGTEELFGFHAGPLLVEVEFGNVVFLWREENRRTRRKTLGTKQDRKKNSTHMSDGDEIECHPCSPHLHYQVIAGLKQRTRKKLEASTDISHRYLLWSHLFIFGWLSIHIITISTICSIKVLFLQTAKEHFS